MVGKPVPEDFDFEQTVINFQFAMMMQMRYGFEKRLQLCQANLKQYLQEKGVDSLHIERMMKKVELRAYHTIPGEFWKYLPQ